MIASVKHNRCIVDKTRAFVNLNELEFLMCPLSPVGLKDDTQHAWVNKPSRRQPVSVLIQPIMADKKSVVPIRGFRQRGFRLVFVLGFMLKRLSLWSPAPILLRAVYRKLSKE